MILDKVKKIIATHTGYDIDSMTLDTHMTEDLDLDSLDAFEILSEIEDVFSLEIDDDALENIHTLKDIVDYIENTIE